MKIVLVILTIVAFAFTLFVNYLAGSGQLNNVGTGELSALYPTLFTPAGFTFSIWGIIYLLNTIFCALQVVNLIKTPNDLNTRHMLAFIMACMFNMAWLVSWHYQQLLLSVVVMLLLLSSLVYAVIESRKKRISSKGNYFEYMNFSVYLGWISVATIANVSAWLHTLEVGVNFQTPLTIAMIAIATLLAMWFSHKLRNYAFGMVVIWALFGMHKAQKIQSPDGYNLIALISLIGMTLIVLSIARRWSKKMVKES